MSPIARMAISSWHHKVRAFSGFLDLRSALPEFGVLQSLQFKTAGYCVSLSLSVSVSRVCVYTYIYIYIYFFLFLLVHVYV